MSVFNYYGNAVPTTTVYEDHGYRSRPGSTSSRFHHTKEGPFVAVVGMPLSVVIEQPEVAAAPFDAALMAAMNRPWPDIVFRKTEVVASGMTPPVTQT
jgi:hypothetical protein